MRNAITWNDLKVTYNDKTVTYIIGAITCIDIKMKLSHAV